MRYEAKGALACLMMLALGAAGAVSAAETVETVYSDSDYEGFSREDCLACHEDADLEAETERGKELQLFVDEAVLNGSVHADLLCTDCHRGAKDFEDAPHNDGKPLQLKKGAKAEITIPGKS